MNMYNRELTIDGQNCIYYQKYEEEEMEITAIIKCRKGKRITTVDIQKGFGKVGVSPKY